MNKIRLGKDIRIEWEISIGDGSISVADSDLTLVMVDPRLNKIELDFEVQGNKVIAKYYGIEQKYLGVYKLTLWYNLNKEGQSALDSVDAFKLVRFTTEENDGTEDIADAEVNLSGNIEVAQKGDKGTSIEKIEQTKSTSLSGGENEITITLDNGEVSKFSIYNGKGVSDTSVVEGTKQYNDF